MKALILASFPESIVSFRGPLIATLMEHRTLVHVAAPGLASDQAVRHELEMMGAVVHDTPLQRTGTSLLADFAYIWRLYRLMRRVRPDMVLAYTIKPVIYGSLSAWVAQVPHRFALITGLGYIFTGSRNGPLFRVARRLYRFSLGRVTKVFFQNADDEALFRIKGLLDVQTPSVVVNGSGIDTSVFGLQRLPSAPARFLMISRLLGDKGVREYAAAATKVRTLHPDVRFDLVGWIDENPDAISQSEMDSWAAEGSLQFLGRLADVRPAIAACSVYVLPSYREGTPRTVLEAMAMGRPIITTDAPGCRETVVNEVNGFLVPVKSVDALVAAMLRFIDDPGLGARMGARSRQIAEDKYDVNKVNEVMLREMGIADQGIPKVAQHG